MENINNGTGSATEVDVQIIQLQQSLGQTIVFSILTAVATLVGLTGNGFVIGLFIARKHLRTICNSYIFSRAVTDTFVLIPNLFLLFTIGIDEFIFGKATCYIYNAILQVGILLSASALECMAIDFYLSSKHNQYGKRKREQFKKISLITIWLIGFIIAIIVSTFGPYVGYLDGDQLKVLCLITPFFHPSSVQAAIICGFIIVVTPLVAIWIFLGLSLSQQSTNQPSEGDGIKPEPVYNKKFMVVLSCVFTVCQLGFWTAQLFYIHYPGMFIPYAFETVNSFLDVNIALNAVLNLMYCKDLYQEFVNLMPKCCKRQEHMHVVYSDETDSA